MPVHSIPLMNMLQNVWHGKLGRQYAWQFSLGWLLTTRLQAQPTASGSLVDNVISYLPKLIAAAVLLAIAWLIATVVRAIVRGIFRGITSLVFRTGKRKVESQGSFTTTDEPRLNDFLPEPSKPLQAGRLLQKSRVLRIGNAIANSLYGFVFLLFLPVILNALGLDLSWLNTLLASPARAFLSLALIAIAVISFITYRGGVASKKDDADP